MTEEENKHNKKADKKKAELRNVSDGFRLFKENFDQQKDCEEKIGLAILFMRQALADPCGPRLKDFWDAKYICIPLFKEQMNPIKRNHLWSEYAQLNQEARRLKEIIDEQTAFSVEQIELAIEALESDFSKYNQLIDRVPPLQFPKNTHKLIKKQDIYQSFQRELHFLKTLVNRLDALRKEAIGTDMRISVKNKLLKRLSKLGDELFPRRKKLIKEISDHFVLDVEVFVKERFSQKEEAKSTPPYVLRDEIKTFQALAKLLTLNTQVFVKTRKMLTECWDEIKEIEKDQKKESEEKSKEFEENKEKLTPKIQAFALFCSKADNLVKEKILDQSSALQNEMRFLPLSREDVKTMRMEIQKIRQDALDKIQEKIEIQEKKDREALDAFKVELENALQNEQSIPLETMLEIESKLLERFKTFGLHSTQEQMFKRQFCDLHSFILDKKGEKAHTLDELEDLLKQREELSNQVKKQIEVFRKEMGGSSLDFEKAMIYRELYDSAKIHLDKEVEAVGELEEKIAEKET